MAAPPPAFRIRTIAYFTGAVHSTEAEWDAEVARAAEFLGAAKRLYEGAGRSALCPTSDVACCPGWVTSLARCIAALLNASSQTTHRRGAGYEVQTTRLVTRALSAATSAASAAATAALLERLCLARGLTFLSLGDTSDEQLLRDGVFSEIAALTNHTSCSFRCGLAALCCLGGGVRVAGRLQMPLLQRLDAPSPSPRNHGSWRPGMGLGTARQLATVIHGLEEGKPGACFRFGVGFNCRPGIPYFPCAAAPAGGAGFAVGTENSGLLHAAFQQAATQAAPGGSRSILDLAHYCLHATFAQALQPVEALAHQLSAATGCPYMGIDASIAPALEPPSLSAAYELVGLGKFGGAGTLAISGGRGELQHPG